MVVRSFIVVVTLFYSSDVTLAFKDAQVIQFCGYFDCLWTPSGLSLDSLWSVSGLSLACLWTVSGMYLDRLWTVYGLSMDCL